MRRPLLLRLYIAGRAPNSQRAVDNLRTLCAAHAPSAEIEVVDVLQEPARALADGVIVTPTLLKLAPAPRQTILGDLGASAAVLQALGLGSSS